MHRWSEVFIPTLREAPADAEVASHKFLVRAGYIRQLGAGIYSYLFLGNRSFNKIMRIVREEMDRIGQEFYLPALHPREVWEASGRWAIMGANLFRLKDRKGADMCLGMTEEEVMTSIAMKELRSYKQLPQIWYQIAPKFRDEPRPKSGLLRVVFGPPNSTRLNPFEADARTSNPSRSAILKFLINAKSSLTVHGVRRYDICRGVSPNAMFAGCT